VYLSFDTNSYVWSHSKEDLSRHFSAAQNWVVPSWLPLIYIGRNQYLWPLQVGQRRSRSAVSAARGEVIFLSSSLFLFSSWHPRVELLFAASTHPLRFARPRHWTLDIGSSGWARRPVALFCFGTSAERGSFFFWTAWLSRLSFDSARS
jgi:hypothetical protein